MPRGQVFQHYLLFIVLYNQAIWPSQRKGLDFETMPNCVCERRNKMSVCRLVASKF